MALLDGSARWGKPYGCGAIVSATDVVTVGHAVKGGGGLDVQLWDGRVVEARVLGALSGPAAVAGPLVDDVSRDLALLRLNEPVAHHLPLAGVDAAYGARVIAVGSPDRAFGALVSASISYTVGGHQLVGVSLEPGWSGAPLVSADGHLVGLVVRGTTSVTLAIPASAIAAGLQELRE